MLLEKVASCPRKKVVRNDFILKFLEILRISTDIYIYGAEKQQTGEFNELWEINAGKPRVVLLP